jgi:hypothetical protein
VPVMLFAMVSHNVTMRIAAGFTVLILLGCSSATTKTHDRYEVRIDALLRERPDDPDLLFLRHSHRDLAQCRKLVELNPTPMVLSSVLCEYLAAGLDADNQAAFERLLRRWAERDPDNGMPVVLQGLFRIGRGNVTSGIETIVQACAKPAIRSYGRECQQETLRLLKRERLDDDIWNLAVPAVRDNLELTQVVLGVSRLLQALSTWNFLEGNRPEAVRLAEAEHRLTGAYSASAWTLVEGALSQGLHQVPSVQLCESALMGGDRTRAGKFARDARDSWLRHQKLEIARKRYVGGDLMMHALRESGLLNPKPSHDESVGWEEWGQLMSLMFKPEAEAVLEEHREALWARTEAEITEGYTAVSLRAMTEEDLRRVGELKPPVDRFMELEDVFYPARFEVHHRDRLIEMLTAEGPESESDWESETRDFLAQRAANALIFHGDRTAVPVLRGKLAGERGAFDSSRVSIVLAALGARDGEAPLPLEVATSIPASCWAAVKFRRRDSIKDFVVSIYVDDDLSNLKNGYSESVTAYLALRELTGQPFGFDGNRWYAWAKEAGVIAD